MSCRNSKLITLLCSSLLFSACGSNEQELKIEQGRKLFEQHDIGFVEAPGCSLCHSLIKDFKLAGPSLYGIGKRAATTKAGMTAHDYLYESIVNPSVYVVDGFRHDLMYPYYENDLEVEEIESLIAFLMTQ